MLIKDLSDSTFDQILDCFFLAFENYFVPLPKDRNYFKTRWQAAGVELDCSYGMFDEDRLVGFILHAVDTRFGFKTAFNTGTGVLPSYRGQKITQRIYQFALRDLIRKGFEKSTLEVITKNKVAIKVYQSVGFTIEKNFKCFKGDIKVADPGQWRLVTKPLEDVSWEDLPHQKLYSWDNQPQSLLAGPYQAHYVHHQDNTESYFVLDQAQKYLAQFDVLTPHHQAWDRLFAAIHSQSPYLRVNNIEQKLGAKIDRLTQFGLDNHIDQYEMELTLG